MENIQSINNLLGSIYPLSWGKKNSYALFSPGIDRFFLVDNYDPWIMLETSRILSSKISNILYILDQSTPFFDNSDCLFYSTKHKMNEKKYGGPTVLNHRQSSVMTKIPKDMVIKTDWPIDFRSDKRKLALLKLQTYSQFVLKVVHAITIAVNIRNAFPEKHYVDNYFKDYAPADFTARSDTTNSDIGMEILIKNILYDSSTVEESLENIHQAWRKHSREDVLGFRQDFYSYLRLNQPMDLRQLGDPGNFDKLRNSQTMWVC